MKYVHNFTQLVNMHSHFINIRKVESGYFCEMYIPFFSIIAMSHLDFTKWCNLIPNYSVQTI